MDFEPQAHTEYKELAQKLLELIPQVFPKRKKKKERERETRQRFTSASKDQMDQFQIIMKGLKKTFKQYSGLTTESFSKHQSSPLLNSAFSEGLKKDLTTLVKG